MLSGCGTYYVNAANDFTATAGKLGPLVQQADESQLNAENTLKFTHISKDASCPVQYATVYVRRLSDTSSQPTTKFIEGRLGVEQSIKNANGGQLPESCQFLKDCESDPLAHGRQCSSICYTDEEVPCLDQIGIAAVKVKNSNGWAPSDLTYISSALQAVRYPETQSVSNKALSDALSYFSQYLDLLKTAATPQPTRFDKVRDSLGFDLKQSITQNAVGLAGKIESVRSGYNDVAKKISDVPTIGGVADANLNKEVGVFGALADTLNTIASTDGSAAQIKKVVEAHKGQLNSDVSDIGADLSLQATRSFVEQGVANNSIRQAYKIKFSSAQSSIDRAAILKEMSEYPAPDQGHALTVLLDADIKDVTKNIIDAHNTLVQMLDSPTRDDEVKKLEAGLKNIKELVAEISAIIAVYK